ncbi:MAG: transposase, partial [Victivallaceae bacterium]|nr:transposase [Victivallaceae bacterium]
GALLYFFKKRGGIPAITAIAHSWGQTMSIHPHVHMLVTGGCLSPDRKEWFRIGNQQFRMNITFPPFYYYFRNLGKLRHIV